MGKGCNCFFAVRARKKRSNVFHELKQHRPLAHAAYIEKRGQDSLNPTNVMHAEIEPRGPIGTIESFACIHALSCPRPEHSS